MKNTSLHQNGYLKEAQKVFKLAKKEYDTAKKSKNEMKARQAAEKGYLCLLKTVNALFAKKGIEKDQLPTAERGRLFFLSKYTEKDFRKTYSAIRHDFHIDCFYEGFVNYKILDERFEDLESLLKAVEQ